MLLRTYYIFVSNGICTPNLLVQCFVVIEITMIKDQLCIRVTGWSRRCSCCNRVLFVEIVQVPWLNDREGHLESPESLSSVSRWTCKLAWSAELVFVDAGETMAAQLREGAVVQ